MAYEEEREEERGGFSFAEFFHVIGKKVRILTILGIALAAALILGLVNMFVLKPGKVQYEMTFMIEYPNSENKLLPDGTPFRYESIIYSDKLNAVKDSDEKYSGIDVEKMTTKRNITISEATRKDQQTISDLGIYTIRVTGDYFSDATQASDFLRAVCDNALDDLLTMIEKTDYSANLVSYNTNTTYSDRIDRLEEQKDFLLEQYDKLMAKYGNELIDGKAINAYRSELSVALNGDVRISALRQELKNKRYLLHEKPEEILENIEGLNRERVRNEAQLVSLREEVENLYKVYGENPTGGLINAFEVFHTRIAELVARNAVIDVEIEELFVSLGYVKDGDAWIEPNGVGSAVPVTSEKFKSDMEKLYVVMTEQTTTCKTVIQKLYQDKSKVVYQQDGVVVVNGGTSTILMAAIGFIGAFVVAAVAVYFIGRHKDNRLTVAAAEPVSELKLEAAVSEEKDEK